MNATLKYLAILAILPLFSMAVASNFDSAEALKSKGVATASYGKATQNIVCGDRLCSEYPGGRDAFEEHMKSGSTIATEDEEAMEDQHMEEQHMEDKHMDDRHMEDKHMDDKHMDDRHMDDKHMDDKHMDKHMDDEHMKESAGSLLKLSRANVPATIPLHHGYYDGGDVYFIITDSSDETHADIITDNQGWKVELAPLLANAPDEALSTTYMFTNGVDGAGVHGFQGEIFTSTPAQADVYSALTSHIHVTWNADSAPRILTSEQEVMDAESAGEVTLNSLDVVLNMPQIVWPDGQMTVKEDKTVADDTPYGGGQVLDIDKENMTVTFIAHRGWGPDGRTIYYIVTDATPSGPAGAMGVVDSPTSAALIANSAAVDLFQFKNGISGSGPLGFQPGIATGAPGDANYSPMWRIFLIGWDDPYHASLLETKADIDAVEAEGMISIELARPMDSDHIVNCPFIDPFQ